MLKNDLLSKDTSLLGAVVFGGYVVDEEWAVKSKMVFKETGSERTCVEIDGKRTPIIGGALDPGTVP